MAKYNHLKKPYYTNQKDGDYIAYYEGNDYITENNPRVGRFVAGIPPCDYPEDVSTGPVMAMPLIPCGESEIIYTTHTIICKGKTGWAISDNFFEKDGDRTLHNIFIAPFRKGEGSSSKGRYISLETGRERNDLMMCEYSKLSLELMIAHELQDIKNSYISIKKYLSELEVTRPEIFV